MIWAHRPECSNDKIRCALTKSAAMPPAAGNVGGDGRSFEYGYGIVQAKAALDLLGPGQACAC